MTCLSVVSVRGASRRPLQFVIPLFLLSACVPIEQLPPGAVPNVPNASASGPAAYPELEADGTSITSMHFTLKGYSSMDLEALKQTAEDLYNKIGNDTGLYTFLSAGNYTLVE